MKAKLSKVGIIVAVLVLSLMTLAGCVYDSKKININIKDGTTPYEIAAKAALPSVANLTVYKLDDEFNATAVNTSVGLVIDNNHILVNKRVLPASKLSIIPVKNYIMQVEVTTKDGTLKTYRCEQSPVEIFARKNDDLGLVLLKLLDDPNRELVPCVFGDSDTLAVGSNTLAVSVRSGFVRTFEALISNMELVLNGYNANTGTMFGGNIIPSSFYTSGNHNNDSVDAYVGDLVEDDLYNYADRKSVV